MSTKTSYNSYKIDPTAVWGLIFNIIIGIFALISKDIILLSFIFISMTIILTLTITDKKLFLLEDPQ